MNPLLTQALGSIIRWGLAFLAGYLIEAGIWTKDDAESYIAAAALAIIGLGWSLWLKYRDRIKFLNALDAKPGTLEKDIPAPTLMSPRRGTNLIPVVLVATLAGGLIGCSGNLPPNVGPAGKVAYQATKVTDAARASLKAIELLTDEGLIPKPVTVQIAALMGKVAQAAKVLHGALVVYTETKGASGAAEVTNAIKQIQKAVTDVLILIPDQTVRQRVAAIVEPILDAVADVLLAWQGPPLPPDALEDWPALPMAPATAGGGGATAAR
jgi:hypothetical protein